MTVTSEQLVTQAVETEWQRLQPQLDKGQTTDTEKLKNIIIRNLDLLDDSGGIVYDHKIKTSLRKAIRDGQFEMEIRDMKSLETLTELTKRHVTKDRKRGFRELFCSFLGYLCLTEGGFYARVRDINESIDHYFVTIERGGFFSDFRFSKVVICRWLAGGEILE